MREYLVGTIGTFKIFGDVAVTIGAFLIGPRRELSGLSVLATIVVDHGLPISFIELEDSLESLDRFSAGHLKCVEAGRARGFQAVLVIQSGAIFSSADFCRFLNIYTTLATGNSEINHFNGGPAFLSALEITVVETNPLLFRSPGLSSHFSLYAKSAFDVVLGWASMRHTSLDVYLCDAARRSGTIVSGCTWPHISRLETERSSASSIGQRFDCGTFLSFAEEKLVENLREFILADPRTFSSRCVHPHWVGYLYFNPPTQKVLHRDAGTIGSFRGGDLDGIFVIDWFGYGREHFRTNNNGDVVWVDLTCH